MWQIKETLFSFPLLNLAFEGVSFCDLAKVRIKKAIHLILIPFFLVANFVTRIEKKQRRNVKLSLKILWKNYFKLNF